MKTDPPHHFSCTSSLIYQRDESCGYYFPSRSDREQIAGGDMGSSATPWWTFSRFVERESIMVASIL